MVKKNCLKWNIKHENWDVPIVDAMGTMEDAWWPNLTKETGLCDVVQMATHIVHLYSGHTLVEFPYSDLLQQI